MNWRKTTPYPQFPYMPPEMDDFYKQHKKLRKVMKLIEREKEEDKKASEEKKKKTDDKKPSSMSYPQMLMLLTFAYPFVGLFQLYLLSLALTHISEALKLLK